MFTRLAGSALVVALLGCSATGASEAPRSAPAGATAPRATMPTAPELAQLERDIRARIAREGTAEIGVVLIDLATGHKLGINEHVSMHAASTMKVPVMLELFRQADEGRFSVDDSITVINEFSSIADGTRYTLATDRDRLLIERLGQPLSLRRLARGMTVVSSNLATNILIEHVGAANVQRTMARIGAQDMVVLRGVSDTPAFQAGMNNTTTAAALARSMEAIARCEITSRESCDGMMEILEAQEYVEGIPSGVPPGARVASKTGSVSGINHDAAIVMPPGREPYVLVVMTRGASSPDAAVAAMVDISRRVWQELVGNDPPTAQLTDLHDRYRVDALPDRTFNHAEYWTTLGPIVERASNLTREEIGRSAEGRPIYLVRYGNGPTSALLWSQMHGNESTASMSLVDHLPLPLGVAGRPSRASDRGEALGLFIPMLNPDGAERFQRHNAQGIDVNRDARNLATPEARALKSVQERLRPDFGFNLHDQNPRTRVGGTERQAAIALLAPAFDESRSDNEVRDRAKHVAATIRRAMEPLVPGLIARYDDAFNPRAFGDLMQTWGTSTVLIESGGHANDPQKQYLRKVNFVGILAALEAIASRDYLRSDREWYEQLLFNGRSPVDILFRGGTVIIPGLPAYRADLAVNFAEPLQRLESSFTEVGDLEGLQAEEVVDLSGLFLHFDPAANPNGFLQLGPNGSTATFVARRGAEPGSEAVWIVEDGIARRVQPER